jgi:hypothetical protein
MDMSPNRREYLSSLFSLCVSNDLKQPLEPKENTHIPNGISLTLFPVHLLREPRIQLTVLIVNTSRQLTVLTVNCVSQSYLSTLATL